MSIVGTSLAVRTALATAVALGGLTCRKYDTWDLQAGNIATLGLARWELSDTPDQAYGVRRMVIPVLVYQMIGNSIDDSLGYQEKNVEKVIDGLGRDRTLGGKVPDAEVGDAVTQSYYRIPNGAAYSVASFDVIVMPFPNVGAA